MAKTKEESTGEERDFPGIGELPIEELQPKIDEWKAKHKHVHQISLDLEEGVQFNGIFRMPLEPDIKSATRSEISGVESNRDLCMRTVLYPDPMDFQKIIREYWGICTPIAGQLTEIAQLTKKVTVKKL